MGSSCISKQKEKSQQSSYYQQKSNDFKQNDSICCFEMTAEQALQFPLQKLTQSKQFIYDQLIQTLTEQDKKTLFTFIRCKPNTSLPKLNIQNHDILIPEIQMVSTQDFFTYTPFYQNQEDELVTEWYLNFADKKLFGFYFKNLYAQDEMQCSEIPILCHITELVSQLGGDFKSLTYESFTKTTPVLIKNVHRLGYVDISPTQECPQGFYGNNFRFLAKELLKERLIKKKSITNVIAMAAMGYGSGVYKEEEIRYTFQTAYKAFATAVKNSDNKKVIIHTGNWGCGAFGNNLQFIALTQIIAARLAQVYLLQYHTKDVQGHNAFVESKQMSNQYFLNMASAIQQSPDKLQDILLYEDYFVDFVTKIGYKWGKSDGN